MDRIPLEQKEIYKSSFKESGDTPGGFNWRNRATQELRFSRLLENLDTNNSPSICDFGCGTGDLHQFLNMNKIEHEFLGLDIVPEMIELAKEKHPNAKFQLDADLKKIPDEEFDLVICSGAFYIRGNVDQNSWSDYVGEVLRELFRISRLGISFNFLGDWSDWKQEDLAYFSISEMVSICKEMSRFHIIDSSYPLFEGTFTILKDSKIKEDYSQEEFKRYLGD